MKSTVSTPAAVAAIVLLLAVMGFFFWRSSQGKAAPVNAQGIPTTPEEAKPGADAMSKIWKTREQPNNNR
jgi:hypothetical protein